MEIYDISQDISHGIAVWPGDPEYRSRWVAQVQDGAGSNVSAIDLSVHTGTHIDAPLHLGVDGSDVASMPLDHFIGNVRVFRILAEKRIQASDLAALDWNNVERVLFQTSNSRNSEKVFNRGFVCLGEDAAEFLVRKRILLVGIDAPSIEAFDSQHLPVHRILLAQGTAILEGVRLENVPPGDYELICLPLKLAGLDGSPVRAILRK
jgi:arylformamidase